MKNIMIKIIIYGQVGTFTQDAMAIIIAGVAFTHFLTVCGHHVFLETEKGYR